MLSRAFAVLAAIAVPLLLTIEAVTRVLPDQLWLGPVLAFALALPVVWAAKLARGQALVGAGLAAMAAAASPELPELLSISGDPDSQVVYDLREAPLPEAQIDGYVTVRGFLRGEWQVDEYRVADGQRPDQNEQAKAVLVPLLGTESEVIAVDGDSIARVIVARVAPDQLMGAKLVTLRGRLQPVSPDIVDSLFAVSVDAKGNANATNFRPEAVMLDSMDVPSRGQALTRVALALGSALLGLVLMVLALPRAGAAKPEGALKAS